MSSEASERARSFRVGGAMAAVFPDRDATTVLVPGATAATLFPGRAAMTLFLGRAAVTLVSGRDATTALFFPGRGGSRTARSDASRPNGLRACTIVAGRSRTTPTRKEGRKRPPQWRAQPMPGTAMPIRGTRMTQQDKQARRTDVAMTALVPGTTAASLVPDRAAMTALLPGRGGSRTARNDAAKTENPRACTIVAGRSRTTPTGKEPREVERQLT